MLKIPKGLKKKKKGKKSKHKEEDDLFDSAELEKFRREQQLKQEAAAAASAGREGDDQDKGEEWEKFKALTSGVDDILNKTKGDLDRIKSTSFYQKKPPGPSTSNSVAPAPKVVVKEVSSEEKVSKGRWVGFDENSVDEENLENAQVQEEVKREEPVKEEEEEDEEDESEFENDQDDIFDTSYVDVVAAGEVKLVYVPDSPEKEEGDDPFDTSIVDKVIKPEIQKKALIGFTLGSAVEVLAGKADKPRSAPVPIEAVKPQRRRPRPQNLLLGSFDEGTTPPPDIQVEPEVIPKSILDEDPVYEEKTSEILGLPPVTPIADFTPSVPVVKSESSSKGLDLKDLVSEFEPPLATPSPVASALVQPEDDLDDEFTELAKSSTLKSLPVESDELNLDYDPFDTSFATKILPGKYELKIIENEVLSAPVSAPADPALKLKEVLTKSELRSQVPEKPSDLLEAAPLKKDLLGGSTSDLSQLGDVPIAPKSETDADEFEDPFDTSVVDKIVAPGKTELKFLEKELLESSKSEDLDFDPRAEEKLVQKPPRPDSLVASKRASIPKVVAFDVKSPTKLPDLLAADHLEIGKVSKPLTPYYPAEAIPVEGNADPFDTSFVSDAPGKFEVELLEKELAQAPAIPLTRKLSDPDFDPRLGEPDKPKADIISGEVDCNSKLHTPVVPAKAFAQEDAAEADFDPFDTSIVSGLVLGKAEVKVLETELIHSTIPQPAVSISSATEELLKKSRQSSSESRKSVADVLEHSSANITVKPLTPAPISSDSFEFDDAADPFDTSAVEKILPGKTEIKILESELLSN